MLRCATRLQQYSGPVVAKGLEDTAFYRYNRFIALNEVGGDPTRFGATIAAFHRATQQRAQRWPHSMLATATHDTKRGEDARARLAALSEYPEEWSRHVNHWTRILRGPGAQFDVIESILRPDRNDEYLLYQQLLGSWPAELLDEQRCVGVPLGEYAERVQATMLKSMREARVHTSWAFPDAAYENAMANLITSALTGARASAFLAAFLPFARQVAETGVGNSLIQTVVKLTSPGVPDLYNGTELWDLSMVDPDNRRPVDYAQRARQLQAIGIALQTDRRGSIRQWLREWPDGRIKLAVTATLLRHRATHPGLYAAGDYQPLTAAGPRAEEIGAYLRSHGNERLLVAFARHGRRRQREPLDRHTAVPLPTSLVNAAGGWVDLLSGAELRPEADGLAPEALFAHLPVAVLLASAA